MTNPTTTPAITPGETPATPVAAVTPLAPEATHTFTGNWNDQKGKLKLKFPNLTEPDLHYENGKKDEMLTRIETKLGKTKEELSIIIAAL